jgi:glycosyltransferase involved in cell wall biosynthesis
MRALWIANSPDRPMTATIIGLQARGVEVHVMCPAHAPRFKILEAAGISMIDFAPRRSIELRAIRKMRAELRRKDYDILHVFGNRAITNAILAAHKMPVRLITYRGIVGNLSFLDPIAWARYLNPRIDRIVCVAEAVRRFLLDMRPAFLRVPPDRLVTIYKGHDLNWYQDQPADLSQLGIPPDAFVIGCVANIRPRKGIEVLVDAAGRLVPELDLHLLLVGNMESAALRERIEASPARRRIHLAGFRADAPALMAACDVFVLPSLKREGLPRAVIEAMAYRTPPIVTNCGGSPELVEDGVSGLVVPPGDDSAIANAVRKLAADPAARQNMGEAARERIRLHFNIENTVRQTLELYQAVLAA